MTNFLNCLQSLTLNTSRTALKLKRFTRVARASILGNESQKLTNLSMENELITDDGSERGVKKIMLLFRENLSLSSFKDN